MTVVEVDGAPITTTDELVAAITAHDPGDDIELSVVPLQGGAPVDVTAELGHRAGEPDVAALGVQPVDRFRYGFPFDIRIDTGKVGGPSAGLAFTLAILDRMTPGSLTGNDRTAVTGTIELDGSVGPVGGVRHKTEAAVSEGAKLFLVPPQEFEEAKEAARGRIAIEQVQTLDEALDALIAHGGDPLPSKRK
jgi:PDZ domain-containing protein